MPTYQYACTECGHRLEAVQSFTDDPLQECPQCTGRLRKVFSSVGVVFKGSGFYRNDSREKPAGEKPKTDGSSDKGPHKGADKGADKSTGTKTEAPAAKSAGSGSSGSGSSGSASSGSGTKTASSSTAGSAA